MLFSTILFYSNNAGLLSQELKTESIVYEKAEPFAPKTIETIGKVIPPVKNIFNSLQQWFEDLEISNAKENVE